MREEVGRGAGILGGFDSFKGKGERWVGSEIEGEAFWRFFSMRKVFIF